MQPNPVAQADPIVPNAPPIIVPAIAQPQPEMPSFFSQFKVKVSAFYTSITSSSAAAKTSSVAAKGGSVLYAAGSIAANSSAGRYAGKKMKSALIGTAATGTRIANAIAHKFPSLKEESEDLAKAYVPAADKAASAIIEVDDNTIQLHRETLRKLSGNAQFDRTISMAASLITPAIEKIAKESAIFNSISKFQHALPKVVEGVITTAFSNIAKAIPEKDRTPNLLQDVITFLIKTTSVHVNGTPDIIDGILDDLKKLDPKKEKDLKKLCEIFGPLHQKLIQVALPNGIEDYGFGWLIKKTFNAFIMPKLNDPKTFVDLYINLMDPYCAALKREKTLEKTAGGRVLLHAAKLASEQVPNLLLQLLSETSSTITNQLLPEEFQNNPNEKERKEIAEKQTCRFKLIKQIKEIATVQPAGPGKTPTLTQDAMRELKEFAGTIIQSVMTKIFENLASDGGKPLQANEDPLPKVFSRLKDLLKKFYDRSGKDLKAQFIRLKADYTEHRTKTLRQVEIKKLQAKEMTLPVSQRDPRKESHWQMELRDLDIWFTNWNANAERVALIKTIFEPFTQDVLEATKMNLPDGLRLNIFGLNKVIQSKIPEGFCFLYELVVDEFPGIMDWLDPESAMKEKANAVDLATGNTSLSMIAKSSSSPISQGLAYLFLRNNKMISEATISGIDSLLPDNMKLVKIKDPNDKDSTNDLAYLTKCVRAVFKNIAKRPGNDLLFQFFAKNVNETLLDILQKNNPQNNPIAQILLKSIEVFHAFHITEGKKLAAEYEKGQNIETLFKQCQKRFETLSKDLLRTTGLESLLNGGKLAVFKLEGVTRDALVRALFDLHYKMTHTQPKQEIVQDQLCESLYDKQLYERNLNAHIPANSALVQIHADYADPNGKKLDVRKKIWAASETQHTADAVSQASQFFSDLIGNSLRALLKNNVGTITTWLTTESRGQPALLQGLQAADIALLKNTLEALANAQSNSVNALWDMSKEFLNLGMIQAIANVIESTPALMQPRKPEKHRQWSLLGDIAVRITHSIGKHMKKIGHDAAKLKTDMGKIKGIVNQKNEYDAFNDKLCKLFLALAKEFSGMAKGNLPTKNPLDFMPATESMKTDWWDNKLPKLLSSELASIFDIVTPNIKPMREELFKIYKSNHVAEYCKTLAEYVRDVTPFQLAHDKEKLGKLLFNSTELLLKQQMLKSGKDLHETLAANKETMQKILSHTIGQIGGNMDRDGALKDFVWPFLEQYSEPLILSFAVKFSKQLRAIENHDPAFMLKMMTHLMEIFARHFKRINEVTKKKKESDPYKISPEQMMEGFDKNLHPALKKKKDDRFDEIYQPLTNDLIDFIGFTKDDLYVPEYLKDQCFHMLQTQLAPLSLNLMFDLGYREDGKEAMLDKMEATGLYYLNAASEAIGGYAAAVKKAKSVTKPSPAQQQQLENLRKTSGKIYHEFVQMIPEWLTQQLLSLRMLKKMSEEQLARMAENFFNDWPPTKIIDKSAENGLPSFRPGVWKGIGDQKRFVPDKRDFDFNLTQADLDRIAEAEERTARDNKCKVAEYAAQGLFIGLRAPFLMLWKKIEKAIISFCNKIFGKNSEPVHRIILGAITYFGKLIHWLLTPIYYSVERILYGVMKIQSGFAHRNLKLPIHKNSFYESAEHMLRSLLDAKTARLNPVVPAAVPQT